MTRVRLLPVNVRARVPVDVDFELFSCGDPAIAGSGGRSTPYDRSSPNGGDRQRSEVDGQPSCTLFTPWPDVCRCPAAPGNSDIHLRTHSVRSRSSRRRRTGHWVVFFVTRPMGVVVFAVARCRMGRFFHQQPASAVYDGADRLLLLLHRPPTEHRSSVARPPRQGRVRRDSSTIRTVVRGTAHSGGDARSAISFAVRRMALR